MRTNDIKIVLVPFPFGLLLEPLPQPLPKLVVVRFRCASSNASPRNEELRSPLADTLMISKTMQYYLAVVSDSLGHRTSIQRRESAIWCWVEKDSALHEHEG